jgi:hypothetical protein
MTKVSELSARFISYIFHPLLMATIGLIFIFYSGTYISYLPSEAKRVLLYLFLSGTLIVPLCFIPIFLYFKIIENTRIDTASTRFIPLLITSILYFSTYYILHKYPIPFINLYLLSCSVCVLINACITPWWKVSSHLIGAGGLTGLVISMFLRLNADIAGLLMASLIIAGLIGFARLRLKAHTQLQVYGGFFIGLVVVCCIIMIF